MDLRLFSEGTADVLRHISDSAAYHEWRKQQAGTGNSCAERFALEYGLEWAYRPYKGRAMRAKQCFRNAFLLADRNAELTYVEGYAAIPDMPPFLHAWCVDADGAVLDPTLKEGTAYWGVPLERMYAVRATCARGFYGLLCSQEPGLYAPGGPPPEVFLASRWRAEILGRPKDWWREMVTLRLGS